jgi:hypothetical protein
MQRSAPYRPPLIRRPSAAGNASGTPGRCPFLGTPADPGTSLAFPSEANHCFRSRFPIPISSIHQENYCLSLQYESCPVYRQFMTEGEAAAVPALALAGAAVAVELPRRQADSAGSSIAPAMAVGAGMALGAGRAAPAFPVAEPSYPDFATDPGPEPEPETQSSRVEGRTVLLGLLLLALLLLAGWAWLTFLSDRNSPTMAVGTVVTLPTLAATAGQVAGQNGDTAAVGAAAEATATALAATVNDAAATTAAGGEAGAAAVAEADSVAATATALFAGAVATAECHAPDWWVLYVTLEGDTIQGLAAARGILPEELIVANCLAAPEVAPGTPLSLPPVGVIVLLASPTPIPMTPTPPVAVQPTRRPPLVLPIATFPVIIINPTSMPLVPEPGDSLDGPDEPGERPPAVRPTVVPTTGARPTSTPPSIVPTVAPTRTPPSWSTVEPTRTPPGWEPEPTRTPPSP